MVMVFVNDRDIKNIGAIAYRLGVFIPEDEYEKEFWYYLQKKSSKQLDHESEALVES